MLRIDIHTHYYPEAFLNAMENSERVHIAKDSDGRRVIYVEGARIVTLTPPMEDIGVRLADMDQCGVDIAVLSISIPNVYFAPPSEALDLAKASNDGLMETVLRYPNRLRGLASVPLQTPEEAPAELERALKMGMVGAIIGTHIDGRPLTDAAFEAFFHACNDLHAVLFLHPMAPLGAQKMQRNALGPMVGFIADTTLAVADLLYSGFPERYPNIRLILPHLGAAIPYLAGRLDNGYRAYAECRENLDDLPSHYLGTMYYDTVSFHGPALRCALETVGAGRIVLGSDYPHVIGDMQRSIDSIKALGLPAEQERAIFSENLRELLHI